MLWFESGVVVLRHPHSQVQSYDRAKEKKGPSRCWFTTNAKVYGVACKSELFANRFASEILRSGANSYGTSHWLISLPSRYIYRGTSYSTKSSFLSMSEWLVYPGAN